MGNVTPDLAQVAARLQASDDRDAVRDLLYRICATVDANIAEDWLDCFIADGKFLWGRDGEEAPLLNLNGRSAMADWFTKHRASNPVGSQTHITLHPVITIHGDTAKAVSSYMTLRAIGTDVVVASAGRYADVAKRCPDSRWRIEVRDATGTMMRTTPAT